MGGGVLGKEAVEARTVPRHGDVIGGGFKGGNDAVGDGLVDIEGLSGAGHGSVLFSAGPDCPAPRPRKPARAGSRTPWGRVTRRACPLRGTAAGLRRRN